MDKARENRLRRMAQRQGMALRKSRRRDPQAIDYGGYMLVGRGSNTVFAGGRPSAYSLTLDEVEGFLTESWTRPSVLSARDL